MKNKQLTPIEWSRGAGKKGSRYISFRNGTTGKEIMDILKTYDACKLDTLKEKINNKSAETIEKVVRRLEQGGYVVTDRVWGKKIVRLSKTSKEHFGIEDEPASELTAGRKLIRRAKESEIKMAFQMSEPLSHIEHKDTFVDSKTIKEKNIITLSVKLSRFYGIYSHANKHYIVFNIGGGLDWKVANERNTKEWLRDNYLNEPLDAAILFVDDMRPIKRMLCAETEKNKLSTKNTPYSEMIIYPLEKKGYEQLQLFRSLPDPETQFLHALFNENEINKHGNALYDGIWKDDNPEHTPTIILFNCDVMRIEKILSLLRSNSLTSLFIACFDSQEDFYKEIFADFKCVEVISFSFDKAKETMLQNIY